MAKFLLIAALCIASVVAVPNINGINNRFTLMRMQLELASIDGNIGACAEELQTTVVAALEANIAAVRECSAGAVEEITKLEEQLEASISAAAAAVEEQVAAFHACADDACKVAAIKEIAGIIAANAQQNKAIIKEALANLEVSFPEAAECARDAFLALDQALIDAAKAFVACVKA